jgi:cell division protein FtsN
MLKFVSKFVLEILPSVTATVIGAYIVNHYIISKPANPPAAAIASTAIPGTAKPDVKPTEAIASAKQAADKPETVATTSTDTQTPDKSIPHEHAAKIIPVATESHRAESREANDLARAVIERLRASNAPARPVEASARSHETPRPSVVAIRSVQPQTVQPASVQPLPPAINIATSAVEEPRPANDSQSAAPRRDVTDDSDNGSRRLIPPADIPSVSRMFGVSGNRTADTTAARTTVADDMLAAAKSVFSAVLPR